MSVAVNSLDEFQHHLARMMRRAGHRTENVGIATLTLIGGILWMKDAGPIEIRTHQGEMTSLFWVILGGERYIFKYDVHLRRLEVRSGSGSGDLLLGVSDETDPKEIMAFLRHLGSERSRTP